MLENEGKEMLTGSEDNTSIARDDEDTTTHICIIEKISPAHAQQEVSCDHEPGVRPDGQAPTDKEQHALDGEVATNVHQRGPARGGTTVVRKGIVVNLALHRGMTVESELTDLSSQDRELEDDELEDVGALASTSTAATTYLASSSGVVVNDEHCAQFRQMGPPSSCSQHRLSDMGTDFTMGNSSTKGEDELQAAAECETRQRRRSFAKGHSVSSIELLYLEDSARDELLAVSMADWKSDHNAGSSSESGH